MRKNCMKSGIGIKLAMLILAFVLVLSQPLSVFAMSLENAKHPNQNIKNIIVLIPDGMSIGGVTLARWYKAYDEATGKVDTNASLTMDELASGLVRTYWSDGKVIGAITDSAPAATAYATGVKTNDKYVGVGPDSKPRATILEAAKIKGKATGIVATSNIQHATPAGFSSHYNDRSKFDILAEQQVYNGIDVVLGGGSEYLLPPYRVDSEDMIAEIKSLGYQYAETKEEMSAVSSGKLWGMFAEDAMAYDMDIAENAPTEPTLAEMTQKAIEILSQDKDGFFLMVEGSKVDWASHANEPIGVISEILAFDRAVNVALDFARSNENTMLLIMSDHGNGGIAMGNADTNLTYSKDPLVKFIAPLKKASMTGMGIVEKFDENLTNVAEVMAKYYGVSDIRDEEIAKIKDTDAEDMNYTVGPMISKRAYIGWTTTGHTGQETNLYTYLPGDERITGVVNNIDIPELCAAIWSLKLGDLTKQLYNDAEEAFKAKGAEVTVDVSVQSGGKMTVTKDGNTIIIPENKNYVTLNGAKVVFDSVTVNQSGRFYVPASVIELIK